MKDSNLRLPIQIGTFLPIKLMEYVKWKLPRRRFTNPSRLWFFSLVAALYYQRYASGRCFLMITHALSSSMAQAPKNKPYK